MNLKVKIGTGANANILHSDHFGRYIQIKSQVTTQSMLILSMEVVLNLLATAASKLNILER